MLGRSHRALSRLVLCAFCTSSCGGNNAAGNFAKAPAMPTERNATCRVLKKQTEPLIVEWSETMRGKLETLRRRGLVAVRYEGCDLEVLPLCSVKVEELEYKYEPFERKQAKVTIRNEDELFAHLPVGALALEGKLRAAGQLVIDMTIVGRYESGIQKVRRDQLEGECDWATHVITDFTVGAFKFEAGADADVGAGAMVMGAGGKASSAAKRELLARDGDVSACFRSTRTDALPPEGCGALIQIEVTSLNEESLACADGLRWTGRQCGPIPKKPICPVGQHVDGYRCVNDFEIVICPVGEHVSAGHCVPDKPVEVVAKGSFGASGALGWALGISSLAFLGAGGIMGTYSFFRADYVARGGTGACDPTHKTCTAAGFSEKSRLSTIGLLGTIGLGVGAGAGLLWLFWPKLAASLRLDMKAKVGEAHVGVTGNF